MSDISNKKEMKQKEKSKEITKKLSVVESNNKGRLVEEKKYFTYINESNAYHTSHVLKKIIKSKPENVKYVYLVISSVDPEIAEKLLIEFPSEQKAQIIAEIISLIQYSKKEIESFDKILRRLLTEQFGGKYVLAKILENLDLDQKTALDNVFRQKFTENASSFRSIMILFEDLFKINEKDFVRIFSDVPSEVLSIAFCNQPQVQVDRLYDVLPKGVKNIVQQGIELGRKKYSKSEINKAQQYVIEYSKNLEKDGFIDPILKEDNGKKES
nr:MAG: hypothetical protein A2Y40_10520 [Candidatus Margulisbacteria bacterium GWF2_35_9]